jgi:hypothetical protein
MIRRHHAIVATFCMTAISLFGAGCEEEEKATPQAIFDARLESGSPGNDCREVGGLFTVGDFGNQALDTKVPSQPIPDGSQFNGAAVSVTCSVTPAGQDEFDVAGSVLLSGPEGGLFRVDGKFKATGEQTGIHAIFAKKGGNTYEQRDRQCIVRYTSTFQGVASGRVWGEITCPKAENPGAETSCEAIAQFRFENCAQ